MGWINNKINSNKYESKKAFLDLLTSKPSRYKTNRSTVPRIHKLFKIQGGQNESKELIFLVGYFELKLFRCYVTLNEGLRFR